MKKGEFKVRDFRTKQFYMKDDEYLNGYARLCGWKATLVYDSLCRHADREQEAFPSINTMAKELAVSRPTIMDGVKALLKWRIIVIEETSGRNNVYRLLDKTEWKHKPHQSTTGTSQSQVPVPDIDYTSQPQALHQSTTGTTPVNHIDSKDTHKGYTLKDTHKGESAHLLKEIKFLKREEITDSVMEGVAQKYEVPPDFVRDCWDTAQNWLDAKGKTQKDYRAFLSNWVKRERADFLLKSKRGFRRGGVVDARTK